MLRAKKKNLFFSFLDQLHFVIVGPPSSPYDRGIYHGVLIFTDEFPFAPPSIIMLEPPPFFLPLCCNITPVIMFTPSGRFAPGKKVLFYNHCATAVLLPSRA
jgi:hypothetical protein